MDDLRVRFRSLDRMPVPDLRQEIGRRAARGAIDGSSVVRLQRVVPGRSPDALTRPRTAIAAAVVLVVVASSGALLAGNLLMPPPSPSPLGAPSVDPSPSAAAVQLPYSNRKLDAARTGSLLTPRCGHVAVRLADGDVLVVGGWTDPEADGSAVNRLVAAAERYDPSTGSFHAVVGDAPAGEAATATLLADGRVLVAGGWIAPAPSGDPFAGEGCGVRYDPAATLPGEDSAAAYLFDPDTDTIEPTGSLLAGRSGHIAARLDDGRVLIAGGNGGRRDGTHGALASAELYDPATGLFAAAGEMHVERGWSRARGGASGPDAVPLGDGRWLIAGGMQTETSPDPEGWLHGEAFDPATDRFESVVEDPASTIARITRTPVGCGCTITEDPRTGEDMGSLMLGPRSLHAQAFLVGQRLVVVDPERVTVRDLATLEEASADQPLPGAPRSPSVMPLDDDHILLIGGAHWIDGGAIGVIGEAAIVDIRP